MRVAETYNQFYISISSWNKILLVYLVGTSLRLLVHSVCTLQKNEVHGMEILVLKIQRSR